MIVIDFPWLKIPCVVLFEPLLAREGVWGEKRCVTG